MLANTSADVVAEEAAERLLPDLNPERKAKKAERIGIGVAKRLALVQADIWAKRGAAGDIYELEPLVVAEETCTRSAIEKVVDDQAQQGHLLIRMQGLQFVPLQQTIQFLETNSLCPAAMCRRSHIPVQKQEKTAQRELCERTLSLHLIGQSGHPKHSQSYGATLSACVF